jgi:hypothetical protein
MLTSLANTLQSLQPLSSKKSPKMLYAIVAIVIIAVAAVGGVLVFAIGQSGGNNVQGDSIKFTVDSTATGGTTYTTNVSAKNIGQNNMLLLWENPYVKTKTVVDFSKQTLWENLGGKWTEYPDAFSNVSSDWSQMWTQIQCGNSTEVTYADDSNSTIRLYNIQINPSLPDSLFEHSSNLPVIMVGVIAGVVIVSIALLIIYRKTRIRKVSYS